MKRFLFYLTLMSIAFASCDEQEDCCVIPQNKVVFNQLNAGQRSTYVLFDYRTEKYTGDTLVFELTEAKADSFKARVFYTEGSAFRKVDELNRRIHDSVYVFSVKIKDDKALFSGTNPLIPFTELDLKPATAVRDTVTNCNSLSYVTNKKALNQSYVRLNSRLNTCATVYDGPGHEVLYSRENGIVQTILSGGLRMPQRWDLIP